MLSFSKANAPEPAPAPAPVAIQWPASLLRKLHFRFMLQMLKQQPIAGPQRDDSTDARVGVMDHGLDHRHHAGVACQALMEGSQTVLNGIRIRHRRHRRALHRKGDDKLPLLPKRMISPLQRLWLILWTMAACYLKITYFLGAVTAVMSSSISNNNNNNNRQRRGQRQRQEQLEYPLTWLRPRSATKARHNSRSLVTTVRKTREEWTTRENRPWFVDNNGETENDTSSDLSVSSVHPLDAASTTTTAISVPCSLSSTTAAVLSSRTTTTAIATATAVSAMDRMVRPLRAGATAAVSSVATTGWWYHVRLGLAGGLAGAAATTALYPVDAAKTLRQSSPQQFPSVAAALRGLLVTTTHIPITTTTSTSTSTAAAAAAATASHHAMASHNPSLGAMTTMRSITSWHIQRAYQGLIPAALGAIPSSALYFGAYESCKVLFFRTLGRSLPTNPEQDERADVVRRLCIHAAAAACGNICSSAIFVPKECIKQQMQFHDGGTFWMAVQHLLKTRGLPGLYTGYRATLLRNIPSAAMRFVVYEELKTRWAMKYNNNNNNMNNSNKSRHPQLLQPGSKWKVFVAGAVAGAVASGLMTPADVIKTRVSTGTCPIDVHACMQHVVQTDGWTSLYAGAGSRMIFSGAFSALGLGTFELCKAWMGVGGGGGAGRGASATVASLRTTDSLETIQHRTHHQQKRNRHLSLRSSSIPTVSCAAIQPILTSSNSNRLLCGAGDMITRGGDNPVGSKWTNRMGRRIGKHFIAPPTATAEGVVMDKSTTDDDLIFLKSDMQSATTSRPTERHKWQRSRTRSTSFSKRQRRRMRQHGRRRRLKQQQPLSLWRLLRRGGPRQQQQQQQEQPQQQKGRGWRWSKPIHQAEESNKDSTTTTTTTTTACRLLK